MLPRSLIQRKSEGIARPHGTMPEGQCIVRNPSRLRMMVIPTNAIIDDMWEKKARSCCEDVIKCDKCVIDSEDLQVDGKMLRGYLPSS